MAYIGNQGSVAGFVNQPSKQDLTGASGGTLTLTQAVSGPEDISLFINNVRQEPTTSYTASGTTVTLQGYTVAASDDIYVLYNGLTQLSSVPVDGSVSTAKIANNAVTDAKLATNLDLSSKTLTMPAGAVLQVVQGIKTDFSSTTSSTFSSSGLKASITPSSTSSKVLVSIHTMLGQSSFVKRIYLKLIGGNAATNYIGDAGTGVECSMAIRTSVDDPYAMIPVSMQYLDSPSTTSSTEYDLHWAVESNEGIMNRPQNLDANGANTASTIILQEIAG